MKRTTPTKDKPPDISCPHGMTFIKDYGMSRKCNSRDCQAEPLCYKWADFCPDNHVWGKDYEQYDDCRDCDYERKERCRKRQVQFKADVETYGELGAIRPYSPILSKMVQASFTHVEAAVFGLIKSFPGGYWAVAEEAAKYHGIGVREYRKILTLLRKLKLIKVQKWHPTGDTRKRVYKVTKNWEQRLHKLWIKAQQKKLRNYLRKLMNIND